MPRAPHKLTTAKDIPMSSLFFETKGAAAAIAEDPQMAVPIPINHPAEAGQLKRFTKILVTINTAVMLVKIPRIGIHPILTKNR